MHDNRHIPVMLPEVLHWLAPQPGDTVVDGTIGLAGHARALAEIIGSNGRLIGIDRDPDALAIAKKTLADAPCRVHLAQGEAGDMVAILKALKIPAANRILLDLGVSSIQLDRPERGFSFQKDGPLDMRMDPSRGMSAEEWLADADEEEIARTLRELGEEPRARRIAKKIAAAKRQAPITTTGSLASIVMETVPGRGRVHPATRTFQAIRMRVNDELGCLERALAAARKSLAAGGRMAVLTFHSLEDRAVKRTFAAWVAEGDFVLPMKKAIPCGSAEGRENRRARSAKLRVIERVGLR